MGKMHLKQGDTVLVISGKSKGARGKILRVYPKKQRVLIEGVNIVKKHQKPTQAMMQGGIIEKEAPIAASNAMLWCPKCNRPARTSRKVLDSGKRVRVCSRCSEVFDK